LKRLIVLAVAALAVAAITCGDAKPGSTGTFGGGTGGG
jgi:hypothetical protein